MSGEILLVLAVLAVATALFASGRVRMDVVALMVLCFLAISGLVTPEEAVAGFSHPAVITIWAMFILSEGLTRSGIADVLGQRLVQLAGDSEVRLLTCLMLLAALMSGFMNNIGVAALLLPVTVGMARQTGVAPSRLLMPMAFACLLGGLLTLIGTAPNLLVSAALVDAGFPAFGFFDFAPVGIPVVLAGTAFVVLAGRHLLPHRDPMADSSGRDLRSLYGLEERIFAVRVPPDSLLISKRISDTGLTSTAGLMVMALTRAGQTRALPATTMRLQAGDTLLLQGRQDRFNLLRQWSQLTIEREAPMLQEKMLEDAALYELVVEEDSPLVGQTLVPAEFFQRFGGWLLAIRNRHTLRRTHLRERVIRAGDCLLVQADESAMERLRESCQPFEVRRLEQEEVEEQYQLDERLLVLRVPRDAALAGRSVGESRLDKAFDFRLMALFRDGGFHRPLPPEEVIEGGDLLLVQGRMEDFEILRGLQQLRILDDATPYMRVFDQGKLAMVEASIHPHASLGERTVADFKLRETYQVEVAAIWRGGRPWRSGLGEQVLQHGDALLLVGPERQLARLRESPDLIVLNPVSAPEIDRRKAPMAAALMALVVLVTLLGWLPIYIAAILGAVLMVLGNCLSMEQAYQSIHWRSIFLIAGMMPMGAAMQGSGAAAFLGEALLTATDSRGPWAAVAALYLSTVLATLVVPNIVLVVLMAPVALSVSETLSIAPHAPLMAVAVAAAASVASPVSHPSSVLVMGPGAYRFGDFLKLGLPLTLVVFLVAALTMPVFWPL